MSSTEGERGSAPGAQERGKACQTCPQWNHMAAAAAGAPWVPIPLRWRQVVRGDVIIDDGGKLWMITEIADAGTDRDVLAVSGTDKHRAGVDSDDVINVLVPAVYREKLTILRDELGARVLSRADASG